VRAERSWHWDAGEDPHIGNVEKTITLEAGGLSYSGWGDDLIIGGGYSIGDQSVAEFLQHGPLAEEDVPAGIVEEIRGYLIGHSRSEAAREPVAGATVGAARLLAYWAPAVRVAVRLHQAPAPMERIWTATPTVMEVTEYGGYPQTFAGPEPGELRYPVEVEALNVATLAGPSEPWYGTLVARDVARRVRQLLATAVMAGNSRLDQRTEQLVDYLTDELTWTGDDLLLVSVAAEPGGTPIGDELHLLQRDAIGRTLRLAAKPRSGRGDTPAGGHDSEPDLRTRVASVTAVSTWTVRIRTPPTTGSVPGGGRRDTGARYLARCGPRIRTANSPGWTRIRWRACWRTWRRGSCRQPGHGTGTRPTSNAIIWSPVSSRTSPTPSPRVLPVAGTSRRWPRTRWVCRPRRPCPTTGVADSCCWSTRGGWASSPSTPPSDPARARSGHPDGAGRTPAGGGQDRADRPLSTSGGKPARRPHAKSVRDYMVVVPRVPDGSLVRV
jgi:hypothetical protein